DVSVVGAAIRIRFAQAILGTVMPRTTAAWANREIPFRPAESVVTAGDQPSNLIAKNTTHQGAPTPVKALVEYKALPRASTRHKQKPVKSWTKIAGKLKTSSRASSGA